VGVRIVPAHLANDAFHPTDAVAPRVVRILIVVDGKLDKKEVNGPFPEDIIAEPKRPGRGACRRDSGIGQRELDIRKALAEVVAHERAIAVP